MHVIDLLTPERVKAGVHVSSKKRLLEFLSDAIALDHSDINERAIFESLCAREKLGSTGLGEGVAIPHGRLAQASTVSCVFARLSEPIDFDAVDNAPVDLIFALVVPQHCNDQHLRLLAEIAEMFNDSNHRGSLRSAVNSAELFDLLTAWQAGQSIDRSATG